MSNLRRILLATCFAAVPIAIASADDARPPHPPHGPPPEAIQACASKAENDACSFQLGERAIEGTCAKGPDTTRPLACRPAHMPPPPSR